MLIYKLTVIKLSNSYKQNRTLQEQNCKQKQFHYETMITFMYVQKTHNIVQFKGRYLL